MSRRVLVALFAATVLGAAVRFAYLVLEKPDDPLVGDAIWFDGIAHEIATGHWFRAPAMYSLPPGGPSALHPPLYPLVLALADVVGLTTVFEHRAVSVLIGLAGIPLIGLLAYRLDGLAAATIAAGVAAVWPALWMSDAMLLSEALTVPLVAALLLVAIATREAQAPGWRHGIALGVLVALAGLTRSECLLFLPLLAVPVLWHGGRSGRTSGVAAATVVVVLLIAPWMLYNRARFEEPVLMSNNLGLTLFVGTNDATFYGPATGYWVMDWHPTLRRDPDEAVHDRDMRDAALQYLGAHRCRAALVVAARVGRVWQLWRPLQTAKFDGTERRAPRLARIAFAMYAAIVPLAVVGAVTLGRRRPLVWLLAPVVLVTVTAATFYGTPRFRVPADVALCAAAAIGVVALPGGLRRRDGDRPYAAGR